MNKDENLLTRLQYINLCFHFEVEQQVNGIFINFFGFNGTAGVWRIKALEDSGGWMERTTVEDMDIAVRAHLKGWKFIYLNDVEVRFYKMPPHRDKYFFILHITLPIDLKIEKLLLHLRVRFFKSQIKFEQNELMAFHHRFLFFSFAILHESMSSGAPNRASSHVWLDQIWAEKL